MRTVNFNFERIGSIEDFYKIAKAALNLPEHFGNNLDALWDSLTADIELPLQVQFTNMTLSQLEQFDNLITLFEDAATETDDGLSFEYYLRKS